MKKFLLALAALSFSLSAFAAGDDDAFYGKIEKMPSAQNHLRLSDSPSSVTDKASQILSLLPKGRQLPHLQHPMRKSHPDNLFLSSR